MQFDPNQAFEIETPPKKDGFDPSQTFELENPDTKIQTPRPSGVIQEGFETLKGAKEIPRAIRQRSAGALRGAGEEIARTSDSYRTHVLHMDPSIDYESGATYLAQKDLLRASNEDEARLALERYYGEGNAGKDGGGRWWVKEGDQKKAVFAGGLEKAGAAMHASAPEMGGMMIGAAAGAPAGPPGVVVGGVLGAVGGKAIDESTKWLEGTFHKSPAEFGKDMLHVAEWNAALSMAGPAAKTMFKPLVNMYRNAIGVTAETRALTQRALELGVTPPVLSMGPYGKALGDKQKLRNDVMGDPQIAKRVAAVQGEMRAAFKSSGMPDSEIDRMMVEILDPTTALTESEVGQLVVPKVVQYRQGLLDQAENSLAMAEDVAKKNQKLFKAVADRDAGTAGADVAREIQESRAAVGAAFDPAYAHIDVLAGGHPFVPTALAKREAAFMTRHIPPDRVPAIFREMQAAPDFMTATDAHRLRSQLRTMANSDNLTPDIGNHEFGRLADAVDAGFAQAIRGQNIWHATDTAVPRIARQNRDQRRALRFMETVDRRYGEEIKFYNDQRVNELAKLSDAGVPPDPQVVAQMIAEVGYTDRAMQIVNKLSPDAKRQVAAADMKYMFDDAERMTRQLGFDSSGKAFASVVQERLPLIKAIYEPVYGAGFVDKLQKQVRELAALDGKLDFKTLEQKLKGLGPGAMTDLLSERVFALKKLDDFVKNNPLGALQSGNAEAVDRAYRAIVQPQADARLAEVYKFFKESAEMDAIRNYARKELLNNAVHLLPDQTMLISAEAIENGLKNYSAFQKDVLFPGGEAQDLAAIARMSKFLFPKSIESEFGTSLAAKSITQKVGFNVLNPRTLWADMRWVNSFIMGWISDRPAVARALVGLENKNKGSSLPILKALARWGLTTQHGGSSGEPSELSGEGAQQAPDGKFYVPDPDRPGKYLRVEQ